MTPEDFASIAVERLGYCQTLLISKGKEYSRNGDRLWNFKAAAAMKGCTPEEALMGMLLKHWVSIMDMVAEPGKVTVNMIDDKLSDNINYSLLLEGLFLERMGVPKTEEIPLPTDNDMKE